MSSTAEKARALRLERLTSSLDTRLEHPDAAVETLMSELQLGELQEDLWEGLHAAAARDGKEAELAAVYGKATLERRLKQLSEQERTSVLLHAADFSQGILGDGAAAEGYLWRVLETVPNHADAFARLERRVTAAKDNLRLAELYALVAAEPPISPGALATAAIKAISQLPSEAPLSDNACRKLLVLLPQMRSLLALLETHCRHTGRFALACNLLEASLADDSATPAETEERRRRLIELYLGDAKTPEKAISHVETLLNKDASDAQARAAAERLLRVPQVASQAAAMLQAARRHIRDLSGG